VGGPDFAMDGLLGMAELQAEMMPRLMRTRVIAMQRYNETHDETQKQQPTPVTNADLSRAIAQGRLRYRRVGDQYVVSQEDVRRLNAPRHNRSEASPKRDTLEMGRTA